MGSRRFGEPVREYLRAVGCRAALIFGEKSALVSRETASYMSSLMGPRAPVVEVPEARHHVMLDQPLGFVAALRMLLDSWQGAGWRCCFRGPGRSSGRARSSPRSANRSNAAPRFIAERSGNGTRSRAVIHEQASRRCRWGLASGWQAAPSNATDTTAGAVIRG